MTPSTSSQSARTKKWMRKSTTAWRLAIPKLQTTSNQRTTLEEIWQASAILLAPELVQKIVVVWLGGHEHHCASAREFNLKQDMLASQLMFDCGVPFVQVPCRSVASHLLTSLAELEATVAGKSAVGDFLTETVRGYHKDHFAWAKEIWDISATAYLVNPGWVSTRLVHSPILTDQCTFSQDSGRHFMRVAVHLNRNAIFADLFRKLERAP